MKMEKKTAKNLIRQRNGDRVNVSNLIHKDSYTFGRASRYTYHCILLCGVKNESRGACCDLVISWLHNLFVYSPVSWLRMCAIAQVAYIIFSLLIYSSYFEKPKKIFLCFLKDFCQCFNWKYSRGLTRPLMKPTGLKGLFHELNTTVIPIKVG